ncbi:MAG: ankyrin repeat domain-containing protein [Legionella sp.]|nr:ankyrin repeat domain-containing protein [Legionella sp.]
MGARHDGLIQLGIELGYFDNERGVCQGATFAWLEASLLKEEMAFNDRIKRIELLISQSRTSSVQGRLDAVKEKVKKRMSLTAEDNNLLEIEPFFQKISLYQSPKKYEALFSEKLEQMDHDKVAQVIASDRIQEQGGIETLSSNRDIYNEKELSQYFRELAEQFSALKTSAYDKKERVGLLISTQSHAMSLVYEGVFHGVPTWRFMDINKEESELIPINEMDKLSAYLFKKYNDDNSENIILNTSFITTKNNPKKEGLLNVVRTAQSKSNIINKDLDMLEIMKLLQLAFFTGDIPLLKTLTQKESAGFVLENMPNGSVHPDALIYLLQQDKENGAFVLSTAAKLGYLKVIDTCAEHGISLDAPIENPPLFIAASNGQIGVIQALKAKGIELNSKDLNNFNIAHAAIASDDANVVDWLIKNQPDLFNQKNKDGKTPIDEALSKRSKGVLRVLLDNQLLDVNQPDNSGKSLMHYAAYTGDLTLLSMLTEYDVNWDATTQNGQTALMLAGAQDFLTPKSPEKIAGIKSFILIKKYQTLDKTERAQALDVLNDDLKEIFKNASQLGAALPYLDKNERQILLNALLPNLRKLIKSGMKSLSDKEQEILIDTLKPHLKEIITDGIQLGELLKQLNNEQRKLLLDTIKPDDLKEIIQNGTQLGATLLYTSSEQLENVLKALAPNLNNIISNRSQLDYALELLDEKKCDIVLKALAPHLKFDAIQKDEPTANKPELKNTKEKSQKSTFVAFKNVFNKNILQKKPASAVDGEKNVGVQKHPPKTTPRGPR